MPPSPNAKFPPKHVMSTKSNIMSGIPFSAWVRVLWRHRAAIEWKTYWFRLLFITCLSLVNGLAALADWLLYGTQVRAAQVNPRPVFILGHPRTGTTLLHNLMGRDTTQFAFCNTFQAGFPGGFLSLERFSWLLGGILDKQRPMDNMDLSFDVPQEDELGTNVLSGGISPYMPLVLMTKFREFAPYFTFKTAAAADKARWVDSFLSILRKLTVRHGAARRLVLKSPVHTARVALLLDLFPNAQFVYIHRNPYDVYRSAVNMADKTYWYSYLSTPTDAQIMDFVMTQYEILYSAYTEDRALIPTGNLHELSFEELERDPVAAMRRVYTALAIPDYDRNLRPHVEAYVAAHSDYQKNDFKPLDAATQRLIQDRWGPSFKTFGHAF